MAGKAKRKTPRKGAAPKAARAKPLSWQLEPAGADLKDIPPDHPRRQSLALRQRLVSAVKAGIAHESGLTAHGRGEAFDYLLGEKTVPEAEAAERAAVEVLVAATRSVVSVNGNVAALATRELIELVEAVNWRRSTKPPMLLEANTFHAGEERVRRIVEALEEAGGTGVLGRERDARIPGLQSHRALCAKDGIFAADAVLVPLEDGDRALALKAMGKIVVAIDLNPLSRTATAADITIVDNVVRALPRMAHVARAMHHPPTRNVRAIANAFDNEENLHRVRARVAAALTGEGGKAA